MKKITAVVLLLLGLGVATVCSAALDLELTQGVNQALPLAIVPFAGQQAHSNSNTIVADIINHDLQNSGQFSVVYADSMDNAPHQADQVNYSHWRQQSINSVVVGSVGHMGANYQVHFQLLDVYNKSVLLDQQFNVSKARLRALAHHISDLIYQKLTGVRGIFSTKIAYVLLQRAGNKATYKLMVADADGYNPQALLVSSQPIMSPAWSPDGRQIAYVSFEKQRATIYLQNVATGQRRVISRYPGINGAPAWSPDGKKLALVLTRTGYPKIYILTLASGKLQRITGGRSLDTEPSWAPDGKSLLFTSDRGGAPQIYRVDLVARKVTRLSYNGNYNARASFTSDGKKVVMLSREDGMFNIAVQDLASGRSSIITQFGMDESPSIAPNGSMVVYATNYGGRGILAEVSLDGVVKLRLPAQEGEVQEPAWSPYLGS